MYPIFKHDCQNCKFLGHLESDICDLYICPKDESSDVVCRFSDEPSDYRSMLMSVVRRNLANVQPFFKEAYVRAFEYEKKELGLRADIHTLGLAELQNYYGLTFATGSALTFPYLRNTESSLKFNNDKSLYQQDKEPAGRFMVFDDNPSRDPLSGWIKGVVNFKNPLVLQFNTGGSGNYYDDNSWKARLSRYFGASEKELSMIIKNTYGFDAIITIKDGEVSETVDLTMW